MTPKRYEEVNYKENRLLDDYKRDIRSLTIIVVITALLGLYACIRGLGIATECEALKRENEELSRAIEMKDSIISDLQEDNIELQKYMKDYLIPKSTINLVYIPKSKVKEKIEEIEMIKKIDSSVKYTHLELLHYAINQLQELLED